eukprot:gene31712-38326_t
MLPAAQTSTPLRFSQFTYWGLIAKDDVDWTADINLLFYYRFIIQSYSIRVEVPFKRGKWLQNIPRMQRRVPYHTEAPTIQGVLTSSRSIFKHLNAKKQLKFVEELEAVHGVGQLRNYNPVYRNAISLMGDSSDRYTRSFEKEHQRKPELVERLLEAACARGAVHVSVTASPQLAAAQGEVTVGIAKSRGRGRGRQGVETATEDTQGDDTSSDGDGEVETEGENDTQFRISQDEGPAGAPIAQEIEGWDGWQLVEESRGRTTTTAISKKHRSYFGGMY